MILPVPAAGQTDRSLRSFRGCTCLRESPPSAWQPPRGQPGRAAPRRAPGEQNESIPTTVCIRQTSVSNTSQGRNEQVRHFVLMKTAQAR